MKTDLALNVADLHTTELGAARIQKNLNLPDIDTVAYCRDKIQNATEIVRRGKNWYAYSDGIIITVNANSHTIITAHKQKHQKGVV